MREPARRTSSRGRARPGTVAAAAAVLVVAGVTELRVRPPTPPPEHRLDPRTADAGAWSVLPGIGPVRAAAIVRDLEVRGPLRSAADLQRVPGIGPVTAARVAPHLRILPPPAAPGNPAR